jgi:ABC-type branched-subunit amino acid transport system ATPase component
VHLATTATTGSAPSTGPALGVPREVLRVEKACAFYGRIQVVFDVSFALQAGRCLTVLGPNGAGKTSLLGALGGTVHGSGRMVFDGVDLSGLPAHRRAKAGLSYVPEARRNLFFTMSVRENLEMGLRLSQPDARPEVLDFVVNLFPILRERMTTTAGMLSGGEQQMLSIAVALGRRPTVLILDEPSQGLAPAIFDILESAFAQLKARGIAILLAEQNLAFASQVADGYTVLSHGHGVAAGGKDDLKNQERIFAAYLGANT